MLSKAPFSQCMSGASLKGSKLAGILKVLKSVANVFIPSRQRGRDLPVHFLFAFIQRSGHDNNSRDYQMLLLAQYLPISFYSVKPPAQNNTFTAAVLHVNMQIIPLFTGRPKGADSIGHTACVRVFWLAGGAAEVDQPAARVQRASHRLYPGSGVAGAGPRCGRPALQLWLWLQEGDHPWPHRVSREGT